MEDASDRERALRARRGGDVLSDGGAADRVRVLRVLREVEAGELVLRADAHTEQRVDHLDDDERHGSGEQDGRAHGEELRPELRGVAVEEAVAAGAVDRLPREQSGGESAPDAADAVDADHVERVVVAEPGLQMAGAEAARS